MDVAILGCAQHGRVRRRHDGRPRPGRVVAGNQRQTLGFRTSEDHRRRGRREVFQFRRRVEYLWWELHRVRAGDGDDRAEVRDGWGRLMAWLIAWLIACHSSLTNTAIWEIRLRPLRGWSS